jgi:hypothetical protein
MPRPPYASTQSAVPTPADVNDVVVFIARALGRAGARGWLQSEVPEMPEPQDPAWECDP